MKQRRSLWLVLPAICAVMLVTSCNYRTEKKEEKKELPSTIGQPAAGTGQPSSSSTNSGGSRSSY